MAHITTIRISDAQKQKLQQLADTLGISPNATVGQLIEHGQIAIVTKPEAVCTLTPRKKNNRHDAKVVQSSNVTAVEG